MTRLLAVVGMKREAAIVAGRGIVPLVGGAVSERLRGALEEALAAKGVCAVISIGLAGGLCPEAAVGSAVVGREVWSAEGALRTDPRWSRRLLAALPAALEGGVAGVDEMAPDARAKAGLFEASGALCVDMESHLAARAARDAGLPFAVLRFISDGADRNLPRSAQKGLSPNGGVDALAVAREALRRPSEIPALIRTGLEAESAFRALLRSRRRLGPTLGFADV